MDLSFRKVDGQFCMTFQSTVQAVVDAARQCGGMDSKSEGAVHDVVEAALDKAAAAAARPLENRSAFKCSECRADLLQSGNDADCDADGTTMKCSAYLQPTSLAKANDAPLYAAAVASVDAMEKTLLGGTTARRSSSCDGLTLARYSATVAHLARANPRIDIGRALADFRTTCAPLAGVVESLRLKDAFDAALEKERSEEKERRREREHAEDRGGERVRRALERTLHDAVLEQSFEDMRRRREKRDGQKPGRVAARTLLLVLGIVICVVAKLVSSGASVEIKNKAICWSAGGEAGRGEAKTMWVGNAYQFPLGPPMGTGLDLDHISPSLNTLELFKRQEAVPEPNHAVACVCYMWGCDVEVADMAPTDKLMSALLPFCISLGVMGFALFLLCLSTLRVEANDSVKRIVATACLEETRSGITKRGEEMALVTTRV